VEPGKAKEEIGKNCGNLLAAFGKPKTMICANAGCRICVDFDFVNERNVVILTHVESNDFRNRIANGGSCVGDWQCRSSLRGRQLNPESL
jgi:hypothetical protein